MTELDDSYYDKLAQLESGGRNIGSPTSSATGPFQILGGTWTNIRQRHPELELTEQDRYDPEKQASAVRAFTQDNISHLLSAGIDPTHTDAYLAHFLGAGGAAHFIKAHETNPAAPAVQYVSPEAAAANQNVFYKKDGSPRNLDEVYQHIDHTFHGTAPSFATLLDQYQGHVAGMQQKYGAQPQQGQTPAPGQPPMQGNGGGVDPRVALLLQRLQSPYQAPQQVSPQPGSPSGSPNYAQGGSFSPATMNYLQMIMAQQPRGIA